MTHEFTKTVLRIAGMHGNTCREKITAALESVAGVKDVDVNLYRAQAVVIHEPPCKAAELPKTIAACGYAAEPIGNPDKDSGKRHSEGT
jgi:copper chaperone CopZ